MATALKYLDAIHQRQEPLDARVSTSAAVPLGLADLSVAPRTIPRPDVDVLDPTIPANAVQLAWR
jgi:hypothetical protein